MLRPCEPVHLAGMAHGKRNLEAIGRSIGKTVNGVRPEIMVISLLAVANYRRTCGLEACDGIPNGGVIECIQLRIFIVS